MGRFPVFCTSCKVDGSKLRLWAMWKLSPSQVNPLKPCTQYPNPHKTNIFLIPTWEKPFLSSYALFFLELIGGTSSGFVLIGFMIRVLGFGLLEQRIGLKRGNDGLCWGFWIAKTRGINGIPLETNG